MTFKPQRLVNLNTVTPVGKSDNVGTLFILLTMRGK